MVDRRPEMEQNTRMAKKRRILNLMGAWIVLGIQNIASSANGDTPPLHIQGRGSDRGTTGYYMYRRANSGG
jgi:hypothetical protein